MIGKAPLRDHGGNLDAAMTRFGGARANWLDLSTGINPEPYPVPEIPLEVWAALPQARAMERLQAAARRAYRTKAEIFAFGGAQGAIQIMPWLSEPGRAAIVAPTYNEHAAALLTGGWTVDNVPDAGAP